MQQSTLAVACLGAMIWGATARADTLHISPEIRLVLDKIRPPASTTCGASPADL